MDAKKYLEKLATMKAIIKNKQFEIEMLKEEAIKPSTSTMKTDGSEPKPDSNKLQKLVCDYVVLEEKMAEEIYSMMVYEQSVISRIEKLPLMQYDLLHKRYVQGLDLQEIASMHNKSYSWATTTNGRAIKNLQKILDEEECTKG